MYITGGEKRTLETLVKFPNFYTEKDYQKCKKEIDYNKRVCYQSQNCDNFCPFKDECNHLRNMKDTVAPRNGIYFIGSVNFVDISVIEQQLEHELIEFYKKKGYVF